MPRLNRAPNTPVQLGRDCPGYRWPVDLGMTLSMRRADPLRRLARVPEGCERLTMSSLLVVGAGTAAEVAAVVAQTEIVPRETLQFHQNQGKGVADGEHHGDTRRGCQPVRARLLD